MNIEQKLSILHSAFSDGLHFFGSYGIVIDYSDTDYQKAKGALIANGTDPDSLCREDVFVQMIRQGSSIEFIDDEADAEDDGQTARLNLDTIEANWDAIPLRYIAAVQDEDYDANDADLILQHLLWRDAVFG